MNHHFITEPIWLLCCGILLSTSIGNAIDVPFSPLREATSSVEVASSAFAVDLDGDTDPDLLSASFFDDKIAWYENRLNQVEQDFGPQKILTINATEANSIYAVDLDQDGDNDIIAGYGHTVGVFYNLLDIVDLGLSLGSTHWYFGDGDTRNNAQTYILVNNTSSEPTTMSLTVFFEDREPVVLNRTADPFSRYTFRLQDELPAVSVEPTIFSCRLITGQPVFAERAMYWTEVALRNDIATTTFRTRATAAIGTRELRQEWFLAEGTTTISAEGEPRDTSIYIVNPNDVDADIEIEFLLEGLPSFTLPLTVPARRRTSLSAGSIPQLFDVDFSAWVRTVSGPGVAVDQTMTSAAEGLERQWSHASLAADDLTTAWYFGDGTLADGFESFLTLANPTAMTTTVNLRFLLESEDPYTTQVVVPASSRETVILSQYPQLNDKRFSIEAIVVSEETGIVVERPIYWRAQGYTHRSGASNTIGATELATEWFMPEGAVFGQSDFQCEFAVGNPSTSDTLIEAIFMKDDNDFVTVERNLPAGRRTTIKAHNHLASPTGETISFSTLIRSIDGTPIIVDRSMYGTTLENEGNIPFFCGHASQAHSNDAE